MPPEGRPLSRMRQQIGEHMKRSQETAATCTTWIEVDVSRVEIARKQLGITALPLIARCTIGALVEFPLLNAWLEGETHTVHEQVNLGIAVSLGEDGLIVPVVRGAQDLSPEGLSRRIRDLARRARARQLSPDDVRGATFTITNPGQFGSMMATPVIAQPQVAILDVEAIIKRPVVVTDALRRGRDRDPPDGHPRPLVGSPRARRRAGGALPRERQEARGELRGLSGARYRLRYWTKKYRVAGISRMSCSAPSGRSATSTRAPMM